MCLGALDGTHIGARIPDSEQKAWRCRDGCVCQNVLGVCRLNGLFSFILAGWEGSAHDGLVLRAALNCGFSIPAGYYYLGDAGYGLAPWLLTPYRGVRYHLREWEKCKQRYVSS